MLSFLFYILVFAWSSMIYVVTFIALPLCYPFDKKRFVVHKLSKWLTDSFFGFGLVMKRKVEGIENLVEATLEDMQKAIFDKALAFRNSMITKVDTWEEFKDVLENKGGFILAHWDGTTETEIAIKEATKATIRCVPFDSPEEEGVCVFSGKPSTRRVLFAKNY